MGTDVHGQVRFCRGRDGTRIAWAEHGEGPPVILTKPWISHLDYDIDHPLLGHVLAELGHRATVVRYDERGYGLSDWDAADLSLDARVSDLEAVAEAAGLDRYAVLGTAQAGQVSIAHALRSPDRVTRLVLSDTFAGVTDEYRPKFDQYFDTLVEIVRYGWTLPDPRFRRVFTDSLAPGAEEAAKRWLDDLQPRCTSRDTAIRGAQTRREEDVTARLAEVTVPTLVLHARRNRMAPFEQGRLMASSIPQATFVPLDGENSSPLATENAWGVWLDEVTRFLAADRASARREASASGPVVDALTDRETEILHLVANGMTNDEIAMHLTLSPRTIERHLSNTYRKLGVQGRSARAAAVAHLLKG